MASIEKNYINNTKSQIISGINLLNVSKLTI